MGFIERPYRSIRDKKVSLKVEFYTALDEERSAIAQANAEISEDGWFKNPQVSARKEGEFQMLDREDVDLMDVSPNQMVSIAASLIPFLENDDANRALMGSNMMRQAVPLLRTKAPLIGTGMEAVVARDSGVTVVAKRDASVESVDAGRIVLKPDDDESAGSNVDIINLIKYQRSNQNTCINQRPIAQVGDHVLAGQVIADGPATDRGEMALAGTGRVPFMTGGEINPLFEVTSPARRFIISLFTGVDLA